MVKTGVSRRRLLALALAGLSQAAIACQTGPAATAEMGPAMRIGLLPLAESVPFYVALDEGYFTEEGVSVDLVPVASAAERDQLMVAGQLDGQVSDLVATVLFNAAEPTLRIVRRARQALPESHQFAILVPLGSDVTSVTGLAGVEIAVSQNSVIQYVTERLLVLEGLSTESIRTVSVPSIPVRMQLLIEGKLAAATLPDPLSALALLQGAQLVVDDSGHPEISQSVIAFRAETISKRQEAVRRVLTAYQRAIDEIAARPEEYHDLLVDKGRVPEELRGTYEFPPLPGPSVPTEEEWLDVVDWCLSKGLIPGPVAYADSVDERFVSAHGA